EKGLSGASRSPPLPAFLAALPESSTRNRTRRSESLFLERTTGFESVPHLAIGWSLSHASPPVSELPLSCTFLALLTHASQQIAGVDWISLVISLVEPS